MSFRRAEAIAFIMIAFIAVVFCGVSAWLTREQIVAQMEWPWAMFWIAVFQNMATGLVQVVFIYLVFKVLFGLDSNNVPAQKFSASEIEPQNRDTSASIGTQVWRPPLIEALRVFVANGHLDARDIGIFRHFELPDGTKLLDSEEITMLRNEIPVQLTSLPIIKATPTIKKRRRINPKK
jgi:hypothetical protein